MLKLVHDADAQPRKRAEAEVAAEAAEHLARLGGELPTNSRLRGALLRHADRLDAIALTARIAEGSR